MSTKETLRCAIYTRKSSEEGLEQDFNSLHAQREACEAYIASQKHEGWVLHPSQYDDGGFSGGNMQRPALKQLMEDITARKINVVVVYKVDRLSRLLHDFARMVEVFDKHNVSFVSVTQQFNTTSSMGRLTLNVLLSFAQFEREVTGERIRDKIAASKKKGMWMGGNLPLGYDVVERKLVINHEEAVSVRMMFQRYLDLGCVRLLQDEMVIKDVRSKTREHSIRSGGICMSRGAIYKLLSNPIYIGQIQYKDNCYPGQHEAIIDQILWDKVQTSLKSNTVNRYKRSDKTTPSLLMGKLFDASSGERLSPSHAVNKGKYYRYYVSQSLLTGTAKHHQGWRLPAQEIEQTVIDAAKQLLADKATITNALHDAGMVMHHIPAVFNATNEMSKKLESNNNVADIINQLINRVELQQDGIKITLSLAPIIPSTPITITRDITMQMKRRGVEMRLVIGGNVQCRVDQRLVKTIVHAHRWFQDLVSGRAKNITEIALREGIDRGDVNKRLSLAFLAPDIIEAIIAGQQPADLTTEKLVKHIDLPLEWTEQSRILGFN